MYVVLCTCNIARTDTHTCVVCCPKKHQLHESFRRLAHTRKPYGAHGRIVWLVYCCCWRFVVFITIISCIMLCARIMYTTPSVRDVRGRGDYTTVASPRNCIGRLEMCVPSGCRFPIRRFAVQWTHVAGTQTICLLWNMYYYCVRIRFVRIILYDAQQLLRLRGRCVFT